MSVTHFISHRFNASKMLPRSVRTMRIIAMVGIAIAVTALIVTMSIGRGFEKRYRKALMDFNAHVIIMSGGEIADQKDVTKQLDIVKYSSNDDEKIAKRWTWMAPFLSSIIDLTNRTWVQKITPDFVNAFFLRIEDLFSRGVVGVTPFLYREALSIGGAKIRGVVIKGVDPDTMRLVNSMSLDFFNGESSVKEALPENKEGPVPVIAGRALARQYGFFGKEGKIKLLIPEDKVSQKNPNQFIDLQIVGTFESGMHDYDAQFILMSLDDARRMFRTGLNAVTGIELRVTDPEKARFVASKIEDKMGPVYRTVTWDELNSDLLSAVRLEKLVSGVIMTLLVMVAALNIVAVLVLMTIHRFHEISLLKALGLENPLIKTILIRGGLTIGAIGVSCGLIGGIAISLVIAKTHVIPLEAEIYLIDSLPIDISPLICGMIVLFCFGVVFLTSFFAAKKLSNVSVAEGLRMAK